eukprot:TRINITY_DN8585_c0_g1_i4.p1 TRINITY_DN8585_c0_g1~~TRINITY_DN8585_c0_g1_i4.p1  ORF type:complete len:208 (-),score=44.49 TRINITY_DN8585_c0_g1_i4:336-959(-)
MKVAASCRQNLRKVFSDFELAIDASDSDLDQLVRHLRSTLSKAAEGDASREAESMVSGLLPWTNFLLNHVSADYDKEDWSRLMWDIYTASTGGTQSVTKCEHIVGHPEGWGDMMFLLLSRPDSITTETIAVWYFARRWVALWTFLLGTFVLFVPKLLETIVNLPAEAEDFDEVGMEVCKLFEAGESIKVTVMTAMGKDVVTDVNKDE